MFASLDERRFALVSRRLAIGLVLAASACGGVTLEEAAPANDAAALDTAAPIFDAGLADATTRDVALDPRDASPDVARADAADAARGSVTCGAVDCVTPAWCQICNPMDPQGQKTCESAPGDTCRPPWGNYPPLRMSCDGQEDCAPGERCILFEGSIGTYVRCLAVTGGKLVCRGLQDCPTDAGACAPYNAPGYPVSICK
jgi:hypothetical protein